MKIVGIYAVIDKNFYVIRNIEILVNGFFTKEDIRKFCGIVCNKSILDFDK